MNETVFYRFDNSIVDDAHAVTLNPDPDIAQPSSTSTSTLQRFRVNRILITTKLRKGEREKKTHAHKGVVNFDLQPFLVNMEGGKKPSLTSNLFTIKLMKKKCVAVLSC